MTSKVTVTIQYNFFLHFLRDTFDVIIRFHNLFLVCHFLNQYTVNCRLVMSLEIKRM